MSIDFVHVVLKMIITLSLFCFREENREETDLHS